MLFAPKEKGQGLVEYALILVLVAIVVIAALMILGPIIGNTFSTINGSLNSVQFHNVSDALRALVKLIKALNFIDQIQVNEE